MAIQDIVVALEKINVDPVSQVATTAEMNTKLMTKRPRADSGARAFESAFARGERIVHRFFKPDQ